MREREGDRKLREEERKKRQEERKQQRHNESMINRMIMAMIMATAPNGALLLATVIPPTNDENGSDLD